MSGPNSVVLVLPAALAARALLAARFLLAATLVGAVVIGVVIAVPSAATAAPRARTAFHLQRPADAQRIDVYAINNAGTVVGAVDERAVAWDGTTGRMRYLTAPQQYQFSLAQDINDSGVIVGGAARGTLDPTRIAVRWNTAGAPTLLTTTELTNATHISDDGHVAGWTGGGNGPKWAVRFVGGRAEALSGAPGYGLINGIADGGVVTGQFYGYMCADCLTQGFKHVRGADPLMLPPAPGGESRTSAITADGARIAGTVDDQAVVWNRFFVPGERWVRTTLGRFRAGWTTRTTGMNSSGTVLVGVANSGATKRAWLHEQGTFVQLPGDNPLPRDANDAGWVAGVVDPPGNGPNLPVIWK